MMPEAESLPAYYGHPTADLTAEQLREYEALAYEIWMLGEVFRLIVSQADRSLKNALVESFALHFRNLSAFLWPTSSPETDVLAMDFIARGERRWTPSRPHGLDARIERAHREVAHLTTLRLPGEHPRKQWQFRECILMVLPALEEFVRRADDAKLHPRVSQEVRRLRALVDDAQVMRPFTTANFTTSINPLLGVIE